MRFKEVLKLSFAKFGLIGLRLKIAVLNAEVDIVGLFFFVIRKMV